MRGVRCARVRATLRGVGVVGSRVMGVAPCFSVEDCCIFCPRGSSAFVALCVFALDFSFNFLFSICSYAIDKSGRIYMFWRFE